jgi:hypothetical protein
MKNGLPLAAAPLLTLVPFLLFQIFANSFSLRAETDMRKLTFLFGSDLRTRPSVATLFFLFTDADRDAVGIFYYTTF